MKDMKKASFLHFFHSALSVMPVFHVRCTMFIPGPEPVTIVPTSARSDITCGADSITIFLPANLLSDGHNVTWREDSCGLDFNGTHYVGTISLSECGTTVKIANDTVHFSNDLIVHAADSIADVAIPDNGYFLPDDPEMGSEITFGEEYETVIPVECIYPRHSNLTSAYTPIKQNVRFYEKRYGQLDLYMRQYENETYSQAVPDQAGPRKVALGNEVYIQVGMNFLSADLRVRLERCIATSTPSPADKNWRELVHLGCPVNVVHLLSQPDDQDVKFSFKAFDFRHNSSGFIYVHCEATVCSLGAQGCSMGCPARARRSLEEGEHSGAHLISTGPLLVDRQAQTQTGDQQSVTVPTVVAAVSLLVAMVAVIMAVIGWSRKTSHKPHMDTGIYM